MSYINGQQVRLTATFTVNGAATDPTTVVFKSKDATGTVTTLTYGTDPQPVRTATGIFYVDLTLSTDGAVFYRFVGTGTCVAASEGSVLVESAFA